jgi:hypothetical protein
MRKHDCSLFLNCPFSDRVGANGATRRGARWASLDGDAPGQVDVPNRTFQTDLGAPKVGVHTLFVRFPTGQ